jgi:hypothetical protein
MEFEESRSLVFEEVKLIQKDKPVKFIPSYFSAVIISLSLRKEIKYLS